MKRLLLLLLTAFTVSISGMAQSPPPVSATPPPTTVVPFQGAAPDNLSGTLSISPAKPTDTWPSPGVALWPSPGTSNRLSPNQAANISVDVAASGEAQGATYERKEMTVTTNCSEPNVFWTPRSGTDNEVFTITNTARDSAAAELTVSAIWKRIPTSGSGVGTGGGSDEIPGSGTANLELLKSVVCWNLPNPTHNIVVGSGTAAGEFNAYIIDQDGWPIMADVTSVTGANYTPTSGSWTVAFTSYDMPVLARHHSLSMTVVSGTVSSAVGSAGNLVLSYDTGWRSPPLRRL